MQINVNNLNNLNNLNFKKQSQQANKNFSLSNQLPTDTFQKNINNKNVSFGSSNDDFLSLILDHLLTGLSETVSYIEQESICDIYMSIVLKKDIKNLISKNKNIPIQKFHNHIGKIDNYDLQFLTKIMEQANIKTLMNLDIFIKTFQKNKETPIVFQGQNIEAIKIFGLLSSKDDLAKFPSLLLYLFNEESNSDNPDYNKLNTYSAFLKHIGIKNIYDFDQKYSYLKPQFNNFENISDTKDAINYLMETYEPKLQMVQNVIDSNNLKSYSPELIYSKLPDVIDYLYDKNKGKNLGDLPKFIDNAFNFDKLKTQTYKDISKIFNDFNSPKDKIDLLELLQECNISINELNTLNSQRKQIPDLEFFDIIINKQPIIEVIKNNDQLSDSQKNELYKNFNKIFTSVYTRGNNSDDADSLNNLINILINFNINNPDKFLNFYNKVNLSNNKNFTTNQLCEFVDLFDYYNYDDLFEQSKKLNISPRNFLETKKEHFEKYEPEITNFIENGSSDKFIGKTALDIYKQYNYMFDENINIHQILQNIVTQDSANQTEDKIRQKEFMLFEQFFDSKHDTVKFLLNNKISFDKSSRSQNHKSACLTILNSLTEKNNLQQSKDKIKKLSDSGFLLRSKNALSKFVDDMQQKGQLKQILNIIINKNVSSVKKLYNFFKSYEEIPNENQNLIHHLSLIPDNMKFNEYIDILNFLSSSLVNAEIPVEINNSNILNININDYRTKDSFNAQKLNNLTCNLLNQPENTNFVNYLENTFTNTTPYYSPFQIAKEIVSKINSSEESYRNLARELHLSKSDLKLDDNTSEYIYIQAVQNKLPQEFINFINSNNWLDYNNNGNVPNAGLHARLRIIDRFALNENNSINNLYSQETENKLKQFFDNIYNKLPYNIEGRNKSHRIALKYNIENKIVEIIFNNKGELITAFPQSSSI